MRTILVVISLMMTSVAARAVPVTVNLGTSAENFVEYGLGPNSENLGTFAFDQGDCAFNGTMTSCTLSGAFTGSAPFTSGTYTLVTSYGGNNRTTALVGTSIAANPNFFTYTSASPSTSITLNLDSASGSFSHPVIVGGTYHQSVTNFGFSLLPPYTCSGTVVASCTPQNVGLTNGAILQGPVTTVVSFEAFCVGDCDISGTVTVNELITLVNIALGKAQPSACADGIRSGATVNVSLIVEAVNNALHGCR